MMSNLGRHPIYIDETVTLSYRAPYLFLKGKEGEFTIVIPQYIRLEYNDPFLYLKREKKKDKKSYRDKEEEVWGTIHAKIRRALVSVNTGFRAQLRLVGVGYRAKVESSNLILRVGLSHILILPIPPYLRLESPKPTVISVKGVDWEKVSHFVSKIRSIRPPEPYKGKGIFYKSESIERKEGKKM